MITVLGCCRQDVLKNCFHVNSVRDRLTYCHYPNEALQALRFISGFKFSEPVPRFAFRSSFLNNVNLRQNSFLREFRSTSLFVIELASPLEHRCGQFYVHEEALDSLAPDIHVTSRFIDIDELYKVMNEILILVGDVPVMLVTHLYTEKNTKRFAFVQEVKEVAKFFEIPVFDPMNYIPEDCYNEYFLNEPILAHYTEKGGRFIQYYYKEFITNNFGINPLQFPSRVQRKIDTVRGRLWTLRK